MLTFTTFGKGSAAVGWAAFSYIGCGMLYTVVNLSYGSLSTVMTTNAEDIAQLNSYRMMGTNISSVLLNAITAPMLAAFSAGSQGYTAKSYTIVAIILQFVQFLSFILYMQTVKRQFSHKRRKPESQFQKV